MMDTPKYLLKFYYDYKKLGVPFQPFNTLIDFYQ
jgi:hypothetical protein